MNIETLKERIENKLVTMQKHPEADLFIYNYTPKVQYEKLWDEITLKTRGLILDSQMNLIARPFEKFFNLEEITELPVLPFDVYEKMDGSLGILYWLNDKPYIASRGSFTSEQAQHGTKILYDKYQHLFHWLDKSATYIFEIIYPQNRIVVDYGELDDIVLLTIIDNKTGTERLEYIGFPVVKKYNGITDIQELRKIEEDNKEGFVIKFNNGFRVKMKFAEYVRLHRIVTNVSSRTVWEYLSEEKAFDDLLDKVPDEFYTWVKTTQTELKKQFNNILTECKSVFKELKTRKESALYFLTQKYPSVLFAMLDKKTPNNIIWRLIKPPYVKPFKEDI